jgi:2-dehydro-3-deoxygluconokinase
MSFDQKPEKHFILVGEALGMLVPSSDSSKQGFLKNSYELTVAGAESNVATHLSRLGHKTTYISRVGGDYVGEAIINFLNFQGVDASFVEVDHARQTGIAVKEISKAGTIVRYYRSQSAARELNNSMVGTLTDLQPDYVHMSGITAAISPSANEFLRSAINRLQGVSQISFDINFRPILWKTPPYDEMLEIANLTNICFVGLDEANAVWGVRDADEVRKLVHRPEYLIVKMGAEGSKIFHPGGTDRVSALQLQVVEPVGAGDAFAAGFLHGLVNKMTPRDSARFGTILASESLLTTSDVGELPEKSYIESLLRLSEGDWKLTQFESTGRLRS